MKLGILLLVLLLMGARPLAEKEVRCPYIENPIRIDGRLDEKDWNSSKIIRLWDKRERTTNQGLIRTLWDENNLYLSFQVQDNNLQAQQTELDHPILYKDDMIEFLIDTESNKESCWSPDDVIYHINLLGQKKDDRGMTDCGTNPRWNGDAKYAIEMMGSLNDSTDVDMGYVMEISISWKELQQKPYPGFAMGIDFAIGDTGKLFDWAGARPFRNPEVFGDLVLEGPPQE